MTIEIEDWYDLNDIRNDLSDDYILVNDLDEDTAGYDEHASENANDGKGWKPIGEPEDGFTGSFDGQGYSIYDLYIDRPDEDNIGLFGVIGVEDSEGGNVENLDVFDADVEGQGGTNDGVGGLAGTVNNNTSIENVAVTGVIKSSDGNSIGGIIGAVSDEEAVLNNSYSEADVITEDSSYVGGAVGYLLSGNSVSNSYATGNVEGNESVGGFIGRNSGEVSDSYATGNVEGNESVGGFIGVEASDDSEEGINKCYCAAETVNATDDDAGAFCGDLGAIGEFDFDGFIFDSYVDIEISNQENAIGEIVFEGESDVEEKQTAEMQGDSPNTEMEEFDYDNDWDTVEEENNPEIDGEYPENDGYPILFALDAEKQIVQQGISLSRLEFEAYESKVVADRDIDVNSQEVKNASTVELKDDAPTLILEAEDASIIPVIEVRNEDSLRIDAGGKDFNITDQEVQLEGRSVENVGDPVNNQSTANKKYVDAARREENVSDLMGSAEYTHPDNHPILDEDDGDKMAWVLQERDLLQKWDDDAWLDIEQSDEWQDSFDDVDEEDLEYTVIENGDIMVLDQTDDYAYTFNASEYIRNIAYRGLYDKLVWLNRQ